MNPYRVIAIPISTTESVRATLKSPRYGHPAHTDVATGYGPCRHCLRTFQIGAERRILFTYDPFEGLESLPLPGPIFVHAEACERYPEDGGFPEDLRSHPLTLKALRSRPAAPRAGIRRGRTARRDARTRRLVLAAQEAGMKAARVGQRTADVEKAVADVVKAGLKRLGLVTDASDEQFRTWYTHGCATSSGWASTTWATTGALSSRAWRS